jgi:23S rRNA (cytidine1920-2'-O)/16S rRNA (cytidine1409-2'-O)-methyltransferase
MDKRRGRSSKHRLDQILVDTGAAPSVKAAQGLIMAGEVLVNEQRVDKPGAMVSAEDNVRLKKAAAFVSRGGDKLAAALKYFDLETFVKDKVVMDIGASTGGFTDCVLQLGAAKVYAVDVGTNQLDWRLRNEPKVKSYEQTDIRDVNWSLFEDVQFIVMDISFNSVAKIFSSLPQKLLEREVKILVLIKPQFELPRADVPHGGVVESVVLIDKAYDSVVARLKELGHFKLSRFDSAVKGRKGNQEVFLLVERQDVTK